MSNPKEPLQKKRRLTLESTRRMAGEDDDPPAVREMPSNDGAQVASIDVFVEKYIKENKKDYFIRNFNRLKDDNKSSDEEKKDDMEDYLNSSKKESFNLQALVEESLRLLKEENRGPLITDGLEIDLTHQYDLNAFRERIDDLFKWHNHNYDRYVAPYFAMIQSSGMGKTKLLSEYRNIIKRKQDKDCLCFLCEDTHLDKNKQHQYYDELLTFDTWQGGVHLTNQVWRKMDEAVKRSTQNQVVLLFDEAQGLMVGKDDQGRGSLVFRAIRWWLRRERVKLQYVAVFVGTTAKLSNFHSTDPPPTGASRNAKVPYKNYNEGDPYRTEQGKILYPPFFRLTTISCLKDYCGSVSSNANQHEMGNQTDPCGASAAKHGRPLFAYYQVEKKLDSFKLSEFCKRMVLSSKDYKNNQEACFSVLGTRVQMGAVSSFETCSNLVSSGYACLVDFQMNPQGSMPHASVAFLPDPVPATLAACLMDGNWKCNSLAGQDKRFWVKQAVEAFKGKLCLPEKGDVGEVFAALYMLFCADVIRNEKSSRGGDADPFRMNQSLSIDLNEWFELLKNGGKTTDQKVPAQGSSDEMMTGARAKNVTDTANTRQHECTLSLLQFCRNNLHPDESFFQQDFLKYMYCSGVAIYVHPNCKAIDLIASIRVKDSNGHLLYHPLVVGVKNWNKVESNDLVKWGAKMKNYMAENSPGLTAVCIILLLGCSDAPQIDDFGSSTDLGLFPLETVCQVVGVKDDEFGIESAVLEVGSQLQATEIYASHGFFKFMSGEQEKFLGQQKGNQSAVAKMFSAVWDALKGKGEKENAE